MKPSAMKSIPEIDLSGNENAIRRRSHASATGCHIFEIPQVPGYRRMSRSNKSVSASLVTTGYAVPIFLLNPYLAGGLFLDYITRGRFPSVPEHPPILSPDDLSALQSSAGGVLIPASPAAQEPHPAATVEVDPASADAARSSATKEIESGHE